MRGFTLLEVLITMVVLAIGLLGLASLQSKVQLSQIESYQRAQAVLLLEDMLARINANRGQAAAYITTTPLGTNDGLSAVCGSTPGSAQDRCEWSNALKGAAESITEGGVTRATGAMANARGCIQQVQARNAAAGVCQPGIYQVTVVWQGMTRTVEPPVLCGTAAQYGGTGYRRAVTGQTIIGLNDCN
ncbi:MAG TPA: type IV pilus modification protein PilV [Verrucomicrobiae bacterium]|nr:type IV pilus modification protein PilV [Verrucomicrobiae bacterium]